MATSVVRSRSIATAAGQLERQLGLRGASGFFRPDPQGARAMIDPGDHAVDAGEIPAVGIDVVPAIDSRLSLVDRAAGDHLADDLCYDVIQTHPSHPGPPV